MRIKRFRWIAIPAGLIFVLALRTLANAAAGSADDADDVTGLDIKKISFTDTTIACPEATVECVTYSLEMFDTFTDSAAGDASIQWELDLTDNGVFGELKDACFRITRTSTLNAELYDEGCGPNFKAGYTATHTGNTIQFKVPKSDLVAAGLETRTKYGNKVTIGAATPPDVAPNTGDVDHCLGATACSGATASPTATASSSASPTPTGSASPTPTGSASPTPTPTLGPNDTSATGTPPKSTVAPGEAMQLTGTGFKPSTSLTMTFFSTPVSLGQTTANAQGAFTANVTIPTTAAAGAHSIVIEGTNTHTPTAGIHRLTFPITVAAQTGSPGPTSSSTAAGALSAGSDPSKLPKTGASIIFFAIAGALLVLTGAAALDGAATLGRRTRLAAAGTVALATPVDDPPLRWGAVGDPTSYDA